MNEKDYLSINEFANEVNVSSSAIYKKLNRDLEFKKYCKVINGNKFISKEAIGKFYNNIDENNYNSSQKYELNSYLEEKNKFLEKNIKEKEDNILYFKEQIEAKDKFIENQRKEIEELNKYIQSQNTKLTEVIENQNELQKNFQVLLKQNNELKAIELGASDTIGKEQPIEKKSLFKRIFNK